MQKRIIANYVLIPEIARLVSDGSKIIFTPKGVSMLPFIRGDMDNVVLVKPKGIDKSKNYKVTLDNEDCTFTVSGFELSKGIEIYLGSAMESELVLYESKCEE